MQYNVNPVMDVKGNVITLRRKLHTPLGVLRMDINPVKHRVINRAWLDMDASIKDIYINGIVHSYVCVSRRQIKNKKAIFIRMNECANMRTNAIRIRFKPKVSTSIHRRKTRVKHVQPQVTTFY